MTNETEKYLAKIKKLLNLARRSSNSHEAATALNQAQALMRKHKLSQNDVDLMDITSKASKGAPSHARSIPQYMTMLGQLKFVKRWEPAAIIHSGVISAPANYRIVSFFTGPTSVLKLPLMLLMYFPVRW